MTRQTSRLASLTQPPPALDGHWGIRQPNTTSFAPNLSAQGVWVNATNIPITTLQTTTAATAPPGVQFFMNNAFLGFDVTFLDPDSSSNIYEQLFEYNTSAIGIDKKLVSANFSIFITNAINMIGPTSVTFELYAYDFGATTEAADYRNQSWLSTATLVASITNTSLTSVGKKTFTNNGSNLVNAISTTGPSRFVLTTSFHRTNVTDYSGQDYYMTMGWLKSHSFLDVTYQ